MQFYLYIYVTAFKFTFTNFQWNYKQNAKTNKNCGYQISADLYKKG